MSMHAPVFLFYGLLLLHKLVTVRRNCRCAQSERPGACCLRDDEIISYENVSSCCAAVRYFLCTPGWYVVWSSSGD